MNIQRCEREFHYSDRELAVMEKKLQKLATFCKRVEDEASYIRIETVQRDTKKKNDGVKVSITVSLPAKVLRAESRRANVSEAIDRCIEKLEPQLKKYKETHTVRSARVRGEVTRKKGAKESGKMQLRKTMKK